MNHEEKRIYLNAIRRRYRKSNKEKKQVILDEFCAVCQYNRKYAIGLLSEPFRRRKAKQKRGRKRRYDTETLLPILKKIWLTTDQMCSKRLKAALKEWLPHFEDTYGVLDDAVRGQMLSMGHSTIDTLLAPVRIEHTRHGKSGTKPGRLLKTQIPVKTDHWDVTMPGFFEADTVAHCGNSLAGDFVWSITLTDIYSAWTEIRATWNKGSHGVRKNIKHVEEHLPFEILGFDCDNGSEFLNYHLINYFREREKPVQFTRSRPYKKNDNAHVEQKNWTHVRHLFGYDRFEDSRLVTLMNDLYSKEWSLYQNHFCPTMKLIEKKKVNSRYTRRYSKPMTPYQRLLASEDISEEVKERLKEQHAIINPFTLKEIIEKKLKVIFQYVKVTTSVRRRI